MRTSDGKVHSFHPALTEGVYKPSTTKLHRSEMQPGDVIEVNGKERTVSEIAANGGVRLMGGGYLLVTDNAGYRLVRRAGQSG